jgi:cytochrome P450
VAGEQHGHQLVGHETTATALSWAYAFLLQSPPSLARLADETAPLRRDPAALAQNEFLDAVVKESLRLRPIVPDVVRYLEEPMTVGGFAAPAGSYLTPCIYLAHRRAESWPEPERFRPERFLGAKIDPYAWFPFGGGTRRCVGMAFALYEMKIVLGVAIGQLRLRLATDGPLRTARRGVTLAPANGLPVYVDAA